MLYAIKDKKWTHASDCWAAASVAEDDGWHWGWKAYRLELPHSAAIGLLNHVRKHYAERAHLCRDDSDFVLVRVRNPRNV